MEAENHIITQKKATENVVGDSNSAANDLPIKASFNRYDSAFTRLIVPLFMTRYIWPAIEAINPWNFLHKNPPKNHNGTIKADFKPEPTLLRAASRNFTALATGTTFSTMLLLYSKNTLHDIHSLYAEAVGYELGKNKEDVTYKDVFVKSHNPLVEKTCNTYLSRTLSRTAAIATFFVPWHKFRGIQSLAPKYEANANAGIGAVGAYLLGESFLRNQSFFDLEQKLGSTAINHTDNKTMEIIQPNDILKLLLLHRNQFDNNYEWSPAGTSAGTQDAILSERITDLMNQTYQNITNIEQAKFTIGKLNYLIGFGLLDKPLLESLAFVELANKSNDMREVKAVATAIKNGQEPAQVFGKFGIDMNGLVKPDGVSISHNEPIKPVEIKFTQTIKPIEKQTHLIQKTHLDFAIKSPEQQLGIA